MPSRSNARDIGIGVLAVVVIIGGAVWFDATRPDADDQLAVAAPETDSTVAAPVADDTAATALADAGDDSVAAASETAPTVTTEATSVPPMAPAIDTFFRNPDETTIVAGRATPGQVVAIMLGGDELGRVETGADGTFGTVVFIAAADQPRRLRLIGDPDGAALVSAESVIVPPSAPLAVAEAPAVQTSPTIDAAPVTAEAPVTVDAANGSVTVTASVDDATPPEVDSTSPATLSLSAGAAPETVAPPTLIADSDGVRVIQRTDAEATKPALLDNIALDTITYDTDGEVILSGRAAKEGFVQVYLDNQPITTSRISDTGDWSIDLPDVDTGVYTLRVDEVDDEGNVQSRIETPFKREERETVAAIMAEETSAAGFDVAVRTVQPGATLWAIAEEQFGEGILYVSVFEANRDQIRDPDLIYPGQVFRIPQITTE